MSIATAITALTNTIRGIATTKGQIKSAVNNEIPTITNEQIEAYPNLIKANQEAYKQYIPTINDEGKQISMNTIPLKPKEFAMIGDTEQKTRILPEGYTQLEYIESDGNQYIDTGINADSNLRVVLDMAYSANATGNSSNVGAIRRYGDSSYTYDRYHMLIQNSIFRLHLSSGSKELTEADTNRHIFDFDVPNQLLKVDSTEFTISPTTFNCDLNFWIFGRNSNASYLSYLTPMKLYKSKMYVSGTLVRDFIPCKNPNNEVGLYDLVSQTFFSNQGTGDFVAGNVVTIPNQEYPQEIKAVKGSQKIIIRSKNLWGGFSYSRSTQGIEYTYHSDGSIDVSGTASATSYSITTSLAMENHIYKTLPAGTYKISGALSNSVRVQVNKTDGTTIITTNSADEFTLTDQTELYVRVIIDSEVEINQKIYIQLEKIDEANEEFDVYARTELPLNLGNIELAKTGTNADVIYRNKRNSKYHNAELEENAIYKKKTIEKIASYNGETITTDYLSSTGGLDIGATIYYALTTPTYTKITDATFILQWEAIENEVMLDGTTIIETEQEAGLAPTLYIEAYSGRIQF